MQHAALAILASQQELAKHGHVGQHGHVFLLIMQVLQEFCCTTMPATNGPTASLAPLPTSGGVVCMSTSCTGSTMYTAAACSISALMTGQPQGALTHRYYSCLRS